MAKDEKISYYWKLAEPIIEKYFKYFQCIRKTNTKDFYNKIILDIINTAIKDHIDEISFYSYMESKIIIAMRNIISRRNNYEPILESFLCTIRQEYPDNRVKIIEVFDKWLELFFEDPLDIASKLMKRGTTLYNIMLIIQESHEIEKVTKDDPERDNGVINSYLELFEEKMQAHIDKSERDYRIRYQYVMSHLREPSFTEEKMIDIGRRILHGDKDAKEELIKSECKLVKMIADEYKDYSFNSTLLIAAGYNALVTSADEYDYTEGVKFRTFASIRIKRNIEKQIIYEWKKTIGFDERCAKIEALEEELLKKGKELTGKEIEKRLGISNGDRVLKIYRLMNAYKEYEKTRFDRGESQESNSKIKKSASIQELLKKMKKLITVDSQYYELFVLKQGLQDGLLRSDSEVASQLDIDPSKIRTYRIAVETAINNNSEARNIYKLIVSKRNQAVDSLRSRLKETVLEKAGIASSTDISENDRDLIILHKRNVTIKEIAIYFQKPCDMIQKRLEELSDYVLKEKDANNNERNEENNMRRSHETPNKSVDIGTTRGKGSYNTSVVSMNDLKAEDIYTHIPRDLFKLALVSFSQSEQKKLKKVGLDRIRCSFPKGEEVTISNVKKFLDEIYERVENGDIVDDNTLAPRGKKEAATVEEVENGTEKQSSMVASEKDLTPNKHCNPIPEKFLNLIVLSFSQREIKILEGIGLEKIRNGFPVDKEVTVDNVKGYLNSILSKNKGIIVDEGDKPPVRRRRGRYTFKRNAGKDLKNQLSKQVAVTKEETLDSSLEESRTKDDSKTTKNEELTSIPTELLEQVFRRFGASDCKELRLLYGQKLERFRIPISKSTNVGDISGELNRALKIQTESGEKVVVRSTEQKEPPKAPVLKIRTKGVPEAPRLTIQQDIRDIVSRPSQLLVKEEPTPPDSDGTKASEADQVVKNEPTKEDNDNRAPKRKRGRPPKKQVSSPTAVTQGGSFDSSSKGNRTIVSRPSQLLVKGEPTSTDSDVTKASEADQVVKNEPTKEDNDNRAPKRKRGRPPKKQVSSPTAVTQGGSFDSSSKGNRTIVSRPSQLLVKEGPTSTDSDVTKPSEIDQNEKEEPIKEEPIKEDNGDINTVPIEEVVTQTDTNDLSDSRTESILSAFIKYQSQLKDADKGIMKKIYGENYERLPQAYPKDQELDEGSMKRFVANSVIEYIKTTNPSEQVEKKPETPAIVIENNQNKSEKQTIPDIILDFVMKGFTIEQRKDFDRFNLERYKSEYPSDMNPNNPEQVSSFMIKKLDEARNEEKNKMEIATASKESKDSLTNTKSVGIGAIQTVSAIPIIRKSLEELAQDKIRVTLNSFNPDDRERLIKGLGPNLEKLSLPIRSILEPDTLHSILVRKLIEFRKEVVVSSNTQEDDQPSNSYNVDRDEEEYSIEQFEQALETIKSDSLANEICLSFDTRKAIITRLFFGLDPSYGRKSVEEITNIFNIPREEVEGTIQEFYETYASRIEETRKTIFGFCKIHTSRQKPKDGKK